MPAPTKRKKAKRTPSTPRAARPMKLVEAEEHPEPCSTLSPDEAFSCDLPTGHTGIMIRHTSADAGGRMWLDGTWRGEKAKPDDGAFAESELETAPTSGELELLNLLAGTWEAIVGKKLAKISSPVKIKGLVLTVDTATADVSQQMSFIADRIIHELRAIDPTSKIHQIALRVKGTLGQSLAIVKPLEVETPPTEIPEGEIQATVDGQPATIVLDGTNGGVKTEEVEAKALLPTIAELEGRIGLAWDDLQDAEREKKRATTEHKEAQDGLNALVKELVRRTRGGDHRQLALGEQAEAPPAEDAVDETDYEALPDNTLVVDAEGAEPIVTSIRHHVWLAADGGAYTYEEARVGVIEQLVEGHLTIASADAVADAVLTPGDRGYRFSTVQTLLSGLVRTGPVTKRKVGRKLARYEIEPPRAVAS